jgi:hypothetical protein
MLLLHVSVGIVKCPWSFFSAMVCFSLAIKTAKFVYIFRIAGGATTDKEGATSPIECKCSDDTYFVIAPGGEIWCTTCPLGARCPQDQSCALRNGPAGACMNGSPLIGVWEPDAKTAKYVLQSCPPDYALLNTLDSNYAHVSSEKFNHDFQRCQQCDPKFEYILNYNGTCKECPRCVPSSLQASVLVPRDYASEGILTFPVNYFLSIHVHLTIVIFIPLHQHR